MDKLNNTGDCNTGDYNTGDYNTGNWNTGNWNTGNWNTGNWNTVHYETGFFNTISSNTIRVFNKNCDLEVWRSAIKPRWLFFYLLIDELEWIDTNNMTEQEKIDNPDYIITSGALRVKESNYSIEEVYKKSAQKSWNETTFTDRLLTYKLPNFDADIAQEIFGIDFKGYLQNNDIIDVPNISATMVAKILGIEEENHA